MTTAIPHFEHTFQRQELHRVPRATFLAYVDLSRLIYTALGSRGEQSITGDQLGIEPSEATAALLERDDRCPIVTIANWGMMRGTGTYDVHVVAPDTTAPKGVGAYDNFATRFTYSRRDAFKTKDLHILGLQHISTAPIPDIAQESGTKLGRAGVERRAMKASLTNVLGMLSIAKNALIKPAAPERHE